MERMDLKPNLEEIPDIERADMSVSPVTAEEMKDAVDSLNVEEVPTRVSEEEMNVELQAMKQAVKDQERIIELQEQIKPPSRPPQVRAWDVPPPERPEGAPEGDEKLEPVILRETDVKYELCKNCEGEGRVMMGLLKCPKCGGGGKVPAMKQDWKSKVVGYRQSESKY